MDDAKCNALKAELAAQPEPQLVPIERFLDGNDDLGFIGAIFCRTRESACSGRFSPAFFAVPTCRRFTRRSRSATRGQGAGPSRTRSS